MLRTQVHKNGLFGMLLWITGIILRNAISVCYHGHGNALSAQ